MFRVILRQHAAWMEHNFAFNEMFVKCLQNICRPYRSKNVCLKTLNLLCLKQAYTYTRVQEKENYYFLWKYTSKN